MAGRPASPFEMLLVYLVDYQDYGGQAVLVLENWS
jgi:hypothetical protein